MYNHFFSHRYLFFLVQLRSTVVGSGVSNRRELGSSSKTDVWWISGKWETARKICPSTSASFFYGCRVWYEFLTIQTFMQDIKIITSLYRAKLSKQSAGTQRWSSDEQKSSSASHSIIIELFRCAWFVKYGF